MGTGQDISHGAIPWQRALSPPGESGRSGKQGDMSMKTNRLRKLATFGQSVWLDYIRRDLIVDGRLRRLIEEDGLRGITSNPSIFEKAIVESHEYDDDIQAMALEGKEVITIYETHSRHDVQRAPDGFRPLYDKTYGRHGYVSVKMKTHLAHDSKGTID